jgi:hypothetical protein
MLFCCFSRSTCLRTGVRFELVGTDRGGRILILPSEAINSHTACLSFDQQWQRAKSGRGGAEQQDLPLARSPWRPLVGWRSGFLSLVTLHLVPARCASWDLSRRSG